MGRRAGGFEVDGDAERGLREGLRLRGWREGEREVVRVGFLRELPCSVSGLAVDGFEERGFAEVGLIEDFRGGLLDGLIEGVALKGFALKRADDGPAVEGFTVDGLEDGIWDREGLEDFDGWSDFDG